MGKPRKQTYTMEMYLNKIKDLDIRNDADVQRLFVWKNEQVNELIYTVLTDDYIPSIILGEEPNSQLYIVDGGQRSASLMKFRHGNYRITRAIENSVIHYRAKARDDKKDVIVDDNGNVVWENRQFDIRNRTYDEFPEELKKIFNEYQIETVIHENSDMKRISKLIKRYNNHTSMNGNQKAFTYLDNFARETRNILDSDFFINCGNYTQKERVCGTLERVVLESVMCMFHLDNWKKEAKKTAEYLNNNATKEEFTELNKRLEELSKVITPQTAKMFNSKDTFLWMGLYSRFLKTGLDNVKFAEFLSEFSASTELQDKEINGVSYMDLCINKETGKTRATKDKYIIIPKLEILETLMRDYLGIPKEELQVELDAACMLEFVRENVNPEITNEDMELYQDMLTDYSNRANKGSVLLDKQNKPSLMAIIAYSCENDIKLDDWILEYFAKNNSYIDDQSENYQYMKCDLEDYIKMTDAA